MKLSSKRCDQIRRTNCLCTQLDRPQTNQCNDPDDVCRAKGNVSTNVVVVLAMDLVMVSPDFYWFSK